MLYHHGEVSPPTSIDFPFGTHNLSYRRAWIIHKKTPISRCQAKNFLHSREGIENQENAAMLEEEVEDRWDLLQVLLPMLGIDLDLYMYMWLE